MPELPEVETIARILRAGSPKSPAIVGLLISRAEIFWHKTLTTPNVEEFNSQIAGQQVVSVERRGKFLVFSLTMDFLLIHLRMSGDMLVLTDPAADLPLHTRMVLAFQGGSRLVFNDPRKFGRVWLVKDPALVTGLLGSEPLDPILTPAKFHALITHAHRQLKPLLLDQHLLAGIGNIYCDEALHLAKLHPLRKSDNLSRIETGRLLKSIRFVLTKGIEQNGASIDWVYRGGDFQNHFRVYSRTGEPCPVCGTMIEHLRVGQRSTHICPHCQPI